jgi:hypothetical protein
MPILARILDSCNKTIAIWKLGDARNTTHIITELQPSLPIATESISWVNDRQMLIRTIDFSVDASPYRKTYIVDSVSRSSRLVDFKVKGKLIEIAPYGDNRGGIIAVYTDSGYEYLEHLNIAQKRSTKRILLGRESDGWKAIVGGMKVYLIRPTTNGVELRSYSPRNQTLGRTHLLKCDWLGPSVDIKGHVWAMADGKIVNFGVFL